MGSFDIDAKQSYLFVILQRICNTQIGIKVTEFRLLHKSTSPCAAFWCQEICSHPCGKVTVQVSHG